MLDSIDSTAFNFEQGQRARKLFAAVVLAALDDAIADAFSDTQPLPAPISSADPVPTPDLVPPHG